MKLLQTIVSGTGFRDVEHNIRRLAVLEELLGKKTSEKVDLVLLPGGYLTVGSASELPRAIAEMARRATAANVTIIAGVDLPEGSEGKGARSPQLPYVGFVTGAVSGGPWRQTSSTSENAVDVAEDDVPGAGRVVTIAGCRIGVLICGELFSWRARESFVDLGLRLAIDLGHYGMGTGVTRAMENVARHGNCAVAHTHHVSSWGGQSLHFVRSDAVRESVPLTDCEWVGDDEFWIAGCIRTI